MGRRRAHAGPPAGAGQAPGPDVWRQAEQHLPRPIPRRRAARAGGVSVRPGALSADHRPGPAGGGGVQRANAHLLQRRRRGPQPRSAAKSRAVAGHGGHHAAQARRLRPPAPHGRRLGRFPPRRGGRGRGAPAGRRRGGRPALPPPRAPRKAGKTPAAPGLLYRALPRGMPALPGHPRLSLRPAPGPDGRRASHHPGAQRPALHHRRHLPANLRPPVHARVLRGRGIHPRSQAPRRLGRPGRRAAHAEPRPGARRQARGRGGRRPRGTGRGQFSQPRRGGGHVVGAPGNPGRRRAPRHSRLPHRRADRGARRGPVRRLRRDFPHRLRSARKPAERRIHRRSARRGRLEARQA